MREPATLQEAQQYIGQSILKFFEYDHKEYKGTILGIDKDYVTGDGVVPGLFYRVQYEDNDEEHLSWDEVSKWLANANNKLKGPAAAAEENAAAAEHSTDPGAADSSPPLPFEQQYTVDGHTISRHQHHAENHLGSSQPQVGAIEQQQQQHQQQQRLGGSQPHADTTPDQQQQHATDPDQYEQLSTGSGGQAAGQKRRRAEPHEQQQQPEGDESPKPAAVPASALGSARKKPRKSANPRMAPAVMFPWQQQAQQKQQQQAEERAQKNRKKQAQAAAVAAASDPASMQEQQGEDAVEDDVAGGGSEECAPQQQQQQQQQHRPSKKARTGEQQPLQGVEDDADMEYGEPAEQQGQQGQQELQRLHGLQKELQGLQEQLQEGQHGQHGQEEQLQGQQQVLQVQEGELQCEQQDLQGQQQVPQVPQVQEQELQGLQEQLQEGQPGQDEGLQEQLQGQGEDSQGQEGELREELQGQQEQGPANCEDVQHEVERDHAAQKEAVQPPRPKQFVVRRQGTAGHIKHVQVINFMCHHNFAIDFGPHVTVIGGRNGSGKSVVLNALQAALGAKVKDTGRGDSIKELVRKGCHEARVKVTLWNTGEDAFQPFAYGDWITIERIIKAAGSTQYKIYSSAGRKVSEGFKNVAALLDHFNVDASNPLAVLTQETAKSFHSDVADQKKYHLFMKATRLQDMHDHLAKASGTVQEMRQAYDAIQRDHDARKAKADDLRSKLQRLQESASLVDQQSMYERAALWAQVKKQQADLDGVRHKLEVKGPEVKAKHEAALAAANLELEEIRRKEEQELAAKEAEEEEQRTFTEAMTALAAELKQAKAATRSKQQAADKLESKLRELQADMKTIMEAERETGSDRQREYEERLREHQAKMARAREALASAEAQLGSCQEQREGMRTAILDKEEEVKQLQRGVQSEQQTLTNLQQHLQQLQQAKGQKLAMFGPHAELRRLVDQNICQFSKPPIGPVGAHLTLTDTKWATAGEVVLGGTLELWIVNNARDNGTLRVMASQVMGTKKFTTLVTGFNRPHYIIPESQRLQPGWRNLREFIKIDHPDPQAKVIIDNKLMDQTRYEVVVVHEEKERCRDAMYANAAGASVLTAVHSSGLNFTRKRNNTIIMDQHIRRGPKRIGASVEEGISQTEELLQASQGRLREAQEKLRAAGAELQELQRSSNSVTQQEKQALGVKSRAAHKVQQLQGQAPRLELDEDDGEDMVAGQLRELQDALDDVQRRLNRAEMELNEARLNEQKAKKLHEDRQAEMKQTLSEMNDRTEALDRLATQKEAASKGKADAEGKLQHHAEQVALLQAAAARVGPILEAFKEAGLKECTEEQGAMAVQKACDILKSEVEPRLRRQMIAKWRGGHCQAALGKDPGFEAAVQRHVQDSLDNVLAAEVVDASAAAPHIWEVLTRPCAGNQLQYGVALNHKVTFPKGGQRSH